MSECTFMCVNCEERTIVEDISIAVAQEKHCNHCYKLLLESKRIGHTVHVKHTQHGNLNTLRRETKRCNIIKPTEFVCTWCARETGVVTIQPKKCKYCHSRLIKKSKVHSDYVFGKDKYKLCEIFETDD